MGNTVGKKKKMSSTASAKWVAPEVQPKKDMMSPLGRSYSMPVHNTKPKADNYHYVALTSTTYGILKVDLPNQMDDRRTPKAQQQSSRLKGEPRPGDSHSFNFEDTLRKFDVPEIIASKQWSDMDEILAKYHQQHSGGDAHARESLEALKSVKEEPETINMWELMEGLNDDPQSPYSSHAATPSPILSRAPPPVGKKARNVGTSLSFSAIHNVKEVDADFLEGAVRSGLQEAVDHDSLGNGKGYVRSPPGQGLGGTGKVSGHGNTPSSGTLSSSRHGHSGKENDSSNSVHRDANLSTVTPVKFNSTPGLQLQEGDYLSTSGNNGSRSLNSGGFVSSAPARKVLEGVQSPEAPPYVNETPTNLLRVSSESRMKKSIATNSSKFAPSSPQVASPRVGSGDSRRVLPSRPKITNTSPPQLSAGNVAYTSPFGLSTSSSGDSEQQFDNDDGSPLFFPELIATLEKDIEDKADNEWHHVRGSDAAGASTSGSNSSDSDNSPIGFNGTVAKRISITNNMNTPSLKNSTQLEVSPISARNQKSESALDANTRRMSSKVAPVDFRDVVLQKVRKADPFDQFEQRCPPGGEARVVIYVTSLRGIRKTFEDCSHMKLVVLGYRVAIDERDVSMHADFKQELRDLLGKPMPVPRIFIKGHYIGGAEELGNLHEDGTLAKLLEPMPKQTSWEKCDGCGDHRFVPCSECSGSCKVVNEDDQVVRCTECNENGLVRCPICY